MAHVMLLFWNCLFRITFFPKNWYSVVDRSFFKVHNALPFGNDVGSTI